MASIKLPRIRSRGNLHRPRQAPLDHLRLTGEGLGRLFIETSKRRDQALSRVRKGCA
jgi:hypothetical protein